MVDEDIRDLFGEIGDMKHAQVNYDRFGNSLGEAVRPPCIALCPKNGWVVVMLRG